MQRLAAGLAALAVVWAAVPAARAQAPAPGDLVVNEVQFDPPAGGAANEWVEVVNRSDQALSLAGLVVTDNAGASGPAPAATVEPGGFAVLVRDGAAFAAAYPGVPFTELASFPSLNNDGDRVGIAVGGVEIDAVDYDAFGLPSSPDRSLERRDPDGPSGSAANFALSEDPAGGTPGRQNSVFEQDTAGPVLVAAEAGPDGRTVTLTVSEPLDPATVTPGAFSVAGGPAVTGAAYDGATAVVLTLAGPLPAGTSTVTATGLADPSGNATATTSVDVTFAPDTAPPALVSVAPVDATTLDVTFSEPLDPASVQPSDFEVSGGIGGPVGAVVTGATVRLTLAAPLQDGTAYTLTVRAVADPQGNELAEGTAPFFFGTAGPPGPRDVVVNEILYDPPAPQPSSNEWVEVVNRTGRAVDLGGLVVTDASGASGPAPAPLVVGPGAFAVFVADGAAFAAAYPGVPYVELPDFPTLNNGGDRVGVAVGGVEIDAVPYQSSWGGTDASLERRDPDGPSASASNFATSTAPLRATPGATNSQFAPDVTGPTLVSAAASPDGRTVTVVLSEPADPATVTTAAFAVEGRTVVAVDYVPDETAVVLTLDAPLAGGATITATGLADPLGNTTPTSQTTVPFTPDTVPPRIARAFALSATEVRVVFTEPVTPASAGSPAAYALSGGVGPPVAVEVETDGDGAVAATLTFETPLADRQVYTLTVSGLVDLAGVVAPSATATLFFGTADTPAPGELVVHEILYDPAAGSDGEFVELYNATADRIFDLSTLTLDGEQASEDPVAVLPGGYAVVARSLAAFGAAFPGVPAVEAPGLSLANGGDTVVLATADGAVVDSVAYDPDWHREELDDATGVSLERRSPAGPSSAASNWSSSLSPEGATPGRANTQTVAANPQEREGGVTVTSPFAPDDGEAGRIAFALRAPAALVRVRIFDGGGRLVREVEDGRLSGAEGEVLWDGRDGAGARLRAGIYVVLVEAVDVEGGTAEAHRAAIVLARR